MTEPVACTLNAQALEDRTEAWRELLDGRLLHREDLSEGVQLDLRDDPGVAEAAKKLSSLEAACCPWMRIEISQDPGRVRLRVTSEEAAGQDVIRGFGLGA